MKRYFQIYIIYLDKIFREISIYISTKRIRLDFYYMNNLIV